MTLLLQKAIAEVVKLPASKQDAIASIILDEVDRPTSAEDNRPSIVDVLKAAPGHLIFQTAEQVDDYIRQERDSWER